MFLPPNMVLMFVPDRTERPWSTVGDHTFRDGFFQITVPNGFTTDLASVPRWLAWLYSPTGRHQQAAVFHDYMYATCNTSRYEADAVFRIIMIRSGVSRWRALTIYLAVRAFGWMFWGKKRDLLS